MPPFIFGDFGMKKAFDESFYVWSGPVDPKIAAAVRETVFNYTKTLYSQLFDKNINSLDWFIEQATVIPKNNIFKDFYFNILSNGSKEKILNYAKDQNTGLFLIDNEKPFLIPFEANVKFKHDQYTFQPSEIIIYNNKDSKNLKLLKLILDDNLKVKYFNYTSVINYDLTKYEDNIKNLTIKEFLFFFRVIILGKSKTNIANELFPEFSERKISDLTSDDVTAFNSDFENKILLMNMEDI